MCHGHARATAPQPSPARPDPVLPFGFREFPKRLPEVVERAIGLGLGGDALRPGGARSDVGGGRGEHRLTLVQLPLQPLDLVVLLRQALLQFFNPLILQQQKLGKVPFQLAHVSQPAFSPTLFSRRNSSGSRRSGGGGGSSSPSERGVNGASKTQRREERKGEEKKVSPEQWGEICCH